MLSGEKRLHWTQRVALIRHNLHRASCTGDFTFFKTLQAHGLLEGTDHVATLNSLLGDTADTVFSTLDNLNAGIAYVHQDAFKNVYDSAKRVFAEKDGKAKLEVDASQQKQMADHAIDRMATSAVSLIQQQPIPCQEPAANVWITGVTVIADAVEESLAQIDRICRTESIGDFIGLEDAWSIVNSSVASSISALKGIFGLMANCDGTDGPVRSRPSFGSFSQSGGGGILRRLSMAMSSSSSASSTSPRQSIHLPAPPVLRASLSKAVPTTLPSPTVAQRRAASMEPIISSPNSEVTDPFSNAKPDTGETYHSGDNIDPLEASSPETRQGHSIMGFILPNRAGPSQVAV